MPRARQERTRSALNGGMKKMNAAASTYDSVIRSVIARELAGVKIDGISVIKDTDEDGDDILRVLIVVNGKDDTFRDAKFLGLIRHFRAALLNADIPAFPIISFVSKKDAKKLNLAAV